MEQLISLSQQQLDSEQQQQFFEQQQLPEQFLSLPVEQLFTLSLEQFRDAQQQQQFFEQQLLSWGTWRFFPGPASPAGEPHVA